MNKKEKGEMVPVSERFALTIEEASAYTGIGEKTLKSISDNEDCDFVLWVKSKRMFKRKKLEEYLEKCFSI